MTGVCSHCMSRIGQDTDPTSYSGPSELIRTSEIEKKIVRLAIEQRSSTHDSI